MVAGVDVVFDYLSEFQYFYDTNKKNYSGTRNIADNGKKYINTVSIRFFFH